MFLFWNFYFYLIYLCLVINFDIYFYALCIYNIYVYLLEKSYRNKEFQSQRSFCFEKILFIWSFLLFFLPTVLLDSVLDFYLRHFPLWQNYWLETFVELPFSGNHLKTQVENCLSIKHDSGWKRKVLGLPTMPVLSSMAAHSQLWLFQFPLVKLNGLP